MHHSENITKSHYQQINNNNLPPKQQSQQQQQHSHQRKFSQQSHLPPFSNASPTSANNYDPFPLTLPFDSADDNLYAMEEEQQQRNDVSPIRVSQQQQHQQQQIQKQSQQQHLSSPATRHSYHVHPTQSPGTLNPPTIQMRSEDPQHNYTLLAQILEEPEESTRLNTFFEQNKILQGINCFFTLDKQTTPPTDNFSNDPNFYLGQIFDEKQKIISNPNDITTNTDSSKNSNLINTISTASLTSPKLFSSHPIEPIQHEKSNNNHINKYRIPEDPIQQQTNNLTSTQQFQNIPSKHAIQQQQQQQQSSECIQIRTPQSVQCYEQPQSRNGKTSNKLHSHTNSLLQQPLLPQALRHSLPSQQQRQHQNHHQQESIQTHSHQNQHHHHHHQNFGVNLSSMYSDTSTSTNVNSQLSTQQPHRRTSNEHLHQYPQQTSAQQLTPLPSIQSQQRNKSALQRQSSSFIDKVSFMVDEFEEKQDPSMSEKDENTRQDGEDFLLRNLQNYIALEFRQQSHETSYFQRILTSSYQIFLQRLRQLIIQKRMDSRTLLPFVCRFSIDLADKLLNFIYKCDDMFTMNIIRNDDHHHQRSTLIMDDDSTSTTAHKFDTSLIDNHFTNLILPQQYASVSKSHQQQHLPQPVFKNPQASTSKQTSTLQMSPTSSINHSRQSDQFEFLSVSSRRSGTPSHGYPSMRIEEELNLGENCDKQQQQQQFEGNEDAEGEDEDDSLPFPPSLTGGVSGITDLHRKLQRKQWTKDEIQCLRSLYRDYNGKIPQSIIDDLTRKFNRSITSISSKIQKLRRSDAKNPIQMTNSKTQNKLSINSTSIVQTHNNHSSTFTINSNHAANKRTTPSNQKHSHSSNINLEFDSAFSNDTFQQLLLNQNFQQLSDVASQHHQSQSTPIKIEEKLRQSIMELPNQSGTKIQIIAKLREKYYSGTSNNTTNVNTSSSNSSWEKSASQTLSSSAFLKRRGVFALREDYLTRASANPNNHSINDEQQSTLSSQWDACCNNSQTNAAADSTASFSGQAAASTLTNHHNNNRNYNPLLNPSNSTNKQKLIFVLSQLPQRKGTLQEIVDCYLAHAKNHNHQRTSNDEAEDTKKLKENISKALNSYDCFDKSQSKTIYYLTVEQQQHHEMTSNNHSSQQ